MTDEQKAKDAKTAGRKLALEALLRVVRRSRNLVKYTRKQKHKNHEDFQV